jgi:hypothetical protein
MHVVADHAPCAVFRDVSRVCFLPSRVRTVRKGTLFLPFMIICSRLLRAANVCGHSRVKVAALVLLHDYEMSFVH